MKALAPLLLEIRIAYYERALKTLQQRQPMHPDIPDIVLHLHRLRAQRPPTEPRSKSPCPPFMCAGSPRCEDKHCAGRIYGLHHTDGGHTFSGGVAFPIEHQEQA